jgi:hypothetical protein
MEGHEMPVSISPRVRSTLLVLTGALVVGLAGTLLTLFGRGGAAVAATVYTRSASCGANDFFPALSTNYYTLSPDDGVVFRAAPDNPTEFVCNPRLPNGATVTRVDFTFRDNSSSGSVTKCGLYRSSLLASSAGFTQAVGVVAGTTDAGTPGTVRRSTTTINNGQVQNANFAYLMRCQVDPAALPISGLPTIGIFGADVGFTITASMG